VAQFEEAASLREKTGQYADAAKLYAAAGLPLMAAYLLTGHKIAITDLPKSFMQSLARDLGQDGSYSNISIAKIIKRFSPILFFESLSIKDRRSIPGKIFLQKSVGV